MIQESELHWLCAPLRTPTECAVKSYNNVSVSTDNNKRPCDMACEGELGTACRKYNAGTGDAQSLLSVSSPLQQLLMSVQVRDPMILCS